MSEEKPWQVQISRGIFPFSGVEATIDERTIVDFHFFGYTEPQEGNAVTFEKDYYDAFGMPQPTFNFKLSDGDKGRASNMMKEYVFKLLLLVLAITY